MVSFTHKTRSGIPFVVTDVSFLARTRACVCVDNWRHHLFLPLCVCVRARARACVYVNVRARVASICLYSLPAFCILHPQSAASSASFSPLVSLLPSSSPSGALSSSSPASSLSSAAAVASCAASGRTAPPPASPPPPPRLCLTGHRHPVTMVRRRVSRQSLVPLVHSLHWVNCVLLLSALFVWRDRGEGCVFCYSFGFVIVMNNIWIDVMLLPSFVWYL